MQYTMATLYLTFGPTHSGKTTFGKQLYNSLVQTSKTIHIDNDMIDEFVKDNFNNLRTDTEVLKTKTPTSPDLRLLVPQLIADYALKENYNVIITASHSKEVIRKVYYEIAKKYDAEVVLLIFQISESILLERARKSQRRTDLTLNAASFPELIVKQRTLLEKPTEQEKSACAAVFYINENNSNEVVKILTEQTKTTL